MLSRKPVASLSINLLQTKFFVNPTADGPQHDPLIHGTLVLSLAKSSVLQSLTVSLLGQVFINVPPDGKQPSLRVTGRKTLERKVSLASGSEIMPAGQTAYAFSLAIPSSTATTGRCYYGRVTHNIVATAVICGKEFETEVGVQIMSAPDGRPAALLERGDMFVDALGLVSLRFTSDYLAVGAPIRTIIELSAVPMDVEIMRVTLAVRQHFEITVDDKVVVPSSQPWLVYQVDEKSPPNLFMPQKAPCTSMIRNPFFGDERPLASIPAGVPWNFEHLHRLPCDDYLRFTSDATTNSPFKITHEFELEIAFRRPDEDIRFFSFRKPVRIASCCVMLADVVLPQYSCEAAPISGALVECICGATVQDFIDQDGAGINGSSEKEVVPLDMGITWKLNCVRSNA